MWRQIPTCIPSGNPGHGRLARGWGPVPLGRRLVAAGSGQSGSRELGAAASSQPGWSCSIISRQARVIPVQPSAHRPGGDLGTESGLAPKTGAGTPPEGTWGLLGGSRSQVRGARALLACISPGPEHSLPSLAPWQPQCLCSRARAHARARTRTTETHIVPPVCTNTAAPPKSWLRGHRRGPRAPGRPLHGEHGLLLL